jgi:segregation and condensation protein B
MRAGIESIRGGQRAETLRILMEKGLVRIAGRHDSLGRPVLYGTTKKFLQVYGLKGLKELPRAEEFGLPAQ